MTRRTGGLLAVAMLAMSPAMAQTSAAQTSAAQTSAAQTSAAQTSAAQTSAAQTSAAQTSAAPGPATAALTTKSGTIGSPASGQGQVVFYRPGSIMGMALGCTVREGEREVARLGSGKYFVVAAAPGKHQYATHGERTDTLNLEVEPGETYFVKCNIGAGIMAGRANISPVDRAEFEKKARGLKMWSGGNAKES